MLGILGDSMYPRKSWARTLVIIDSLYQRYARASYLKFKKQWYAGRPPTNGIPQLPAQQTFSKIWVFYRNKNGLKNIRGNRLVNWLIDQFGHRCLNYESSRQEIKQQAIKLMVDQKLVMISAYRFRRALGAAIRTFRSDECEERFTRLGQSLGTSFRALPIVKRWTAAQELLRYPSAALGRANLPKMAEEYRIFRDISTSLTKNNLDPQILLDNPDCDRLFQFVERRPPSILRRWEQRRILEALPFYLAGRLRESIDAVLLCLVRKARLLQSRVHDEVEEDRRDESLALLERSGRHIHSLQIAIGEALASGTPTPLIPFQRTLSRLSKDSASTLDRNRLYLLIGSRGIYTRKFARRLVGIQFKGHDPHANSIVDVLQEIFRFAPFNEKVPKISVDKASFLQVPSNLLSQRQVFEPIVIITLADCLWSGRITASLSRRFADVWTRIPESKNGIDPAEWVRNRRCQLDRAWKAFENKARGTNLVKDGRLHIEKLLRRRSRQAEMNHRERHDAMVSRFDVVPILDVVLKVHRMTGFLDNFKLSQKSPHQLSNEDRLRLASGTLITEGMNIGTREMPTVLDREYTVGRLQGFIDNYMTKANLEATLECLLTAWDERKMGKFWGPGDSISVDGRVIGAFQNNLLSRYHYRKGRSGMTVYWYLRDDGIPTRVKPLGNQEWEAWHVLDELLHPLAGQKLASSCGDTQGQFLALWGLAEMVDKRIMARFRRPSRVRLFKPSARNRANMITLRTIRWDIIERGLPSMFRLAEAIKSGKIRAVEVLRRWHLFNDKGIDVAEAYRELGKVDRTEFLLDYASDKDLQRKVRDGCNDAEMWNSFHEAIFWGNGGKLRSNNPLRQEESLLALTLLMFSIIFYNVEKYGKRMKKARAPTPVIWDNIQVLGKYQFRRSWISGCSSTVKGPKME
jgi:TnpA family transposase